MRVFSRFMVILVVLVVASVGFGNDYILPKYNGGGGGFMVVATYIAGVDGINSKLNSLGYSGRINEVLFGIGGMGYGIFDRVLLGGYGVSLMSSSVEGRFNGTNVVGEFTGGFGMFEVGYSVFKTKNFEVIPVVNVGGGGFSLDFYSKVDPQEFDNIATRPISYSAYVDYGGVMVGIGVLLPARITFGERITKICENNFYSYSTIEAVFRLNYSYTFSTDDDSVIGEPKLLGHSLTFGVSIFFGGYSEKVD